MEQNKELTVSESLALISETLNNSRRDILRNNSKYFVLWGCLLTVFSLAIYFLWHASGSPVWNLAWFGMPVVGFALAALIGRKDQAMPSSEITRILRNVWRLFAAFSLSISAIACFAVPMNISLLIIVMLGLAESVSGVILKNWPIIVAGFVLGVAGAVAAVLLKTEAQLLLFTRGGVLLAITGLIVKAQNK